MAAGANKYAPFLLQKRWQEQDRHRDSRVQTLRGTQAFKPDFKKGPKAQSSFLTSNEYSSAYAPPPNFTSPGPTPQMGQPITVPKRPPWHDDFPHCSFSSYTASDVHHGDSHEHHQQPQQGRRPFSAREGFQERNIRDSLKENLNFEGKPFFTNVSEHRKSQERPRQRPFTCKERSSIAQDKEIPNVYRNRTPKSSNITSAGSEYNVSNRQQSAKGSNIVSILRTAGSKRPISSRRVNIRADDNSTKQPHCNNHPNETSKIPPIRKPRWMKDFVVKPSGTSQYSREVLEQDFKKHRYIQEQMLQRGNVDTRMKPPVVPYEFPLQESTKVSTDDDGSVALSCFSDGASFTAVSRTPSPSPSPTLSPTPSPVLIQPLHMPTAGSLTHATAGVDGTAASMPGGMPAGVAGGMSGGMPGGMPGGITGGMPGGMPGASSTSARTGAALTVESHLVKGGAASAVRGAGRYDTYMDGAFRDMLNPFAHLKKEYMMHHDIDPVSGNRTSDENFADEKVEKKNRRRKVEKPDDTQDFFVPRVLDSSESTPVPEDEREGEDEHDKESEPEPSAAAEGGNQAATDEPTTLQYKKLQYKHKKDFNMEDYIPPSHVLKLAKAVENMSNSSRSDDSSENEITFVIKDGKQGKFILKDDTLIPTKKPIFQKKRARKKSRHDKEVQDKENREVHYIDYDKDGDAGEGKGDDEEKILDEHFVRKLCTAEEKRRKKKDETKRSYSQFKETDRKVLAKKALAKIESANRELLGIKDAPKKEMRKTDEGRRELLPKVEDGTTEADLVRRELGKEEDIAVDTSIEVTASADPGKAEKTEKVGSGKEDAREDLGGKKDEEGVEVSTARGKKQDEKQSETEGKQEPEKEREKCGAEDDVVAETTVTEEETTQDEGARRSEETEDDEDRSETEVDIGVEGWAEDQDSDPDREIYLSKRVRCRPSSSIYDYLPPLNPDPVLDEGDANRCKARLQGDTVVIREALARNERADLETVVDVIIANNTNNRRWLRHLYRDEYLQSLLLDLRKTLPADIASVVSYMMIPICEFDAMCLWDALKGLHKDPEVLCEILCTRTNEELQAIKEAYLLRYGEDLLDHIEDETIGVFQRILIRLSEGEREVEEIWNKSDCAKEAKAIAALLEVKGAYLEKKLIDVFCTHSLEMLRSVLTEYRKHKGNDMDQDVVRIMKGNFCRAIVTILHYISNPPNYFVEKLHNSHFKGNDDDKSLCRIIISRAETDLDMIKMLFQLRYGMELHAYIDQVCHGALKGLALRLISANVKGDERMQLDFPPLWPGDEEIHLIQRLTLEDVIQIMIRKSKFLSKGQKIIALRREKQREAEEAAQSSESGESEVEADVPEVMEERAQDSEEEEERAQKEAQRELRDGLKNISFADEVQVHEDGLGGESFKSVFADVSFAEASRGILKVAQDEDMKDEDEATGVTKELQEEFGNVKSNWPKVTQLNGPVLDPTFSGRQEVKRKKILIQRSKRKAFRGTVSGISMDHFNALRDAQAIGKAMLQKNRNMEGIIQFLTTRNNAQRQLIIREFFRRYRRDLVDDLRVLTPMNEEIILSLLLSGEVYDAASLYSFYTSDNLVVTIDGLIEILLTRQNDEILIMKRAFTGIFGMDVGEVIEKKTKNHFTKLLLTVADGKRDQTSEHVDSYMAKKDAQSLYEAIIKKPTNYDLFIEIFALRSFAHIEAVCDHFPEIAQVDILEVLDSCLKGGFLEAIITIICMVRDTEMFFCERIYRAVSYEPQNFAMLIRLIIGRCELDLQVIKQTFRRTYGRTIYDIIEKETDFASKKILLSVIKR